MAEIHPTAVVHPTAELADDVTVEAYAWVGEGVSLGAGCRVQHHATVEGPSVFGERNLIHPYAYVGAKTQDLKYAGGVTRLEVGNDNTFREFCTIHRATSDGDATRIGHHNLFLAYTHVAHDCVVGNHVILSNNGTLGGHVVMEDYAILGGLTAVHQFCRIGQHAMLGGCGKVVQDIPPYMVGDGNPCEIRSINKIGLERRGFNEEAINAIRHAFKVLYKEGLNRAQAVARLEAERGPGQVYREEILAFIAASTRGLT